MMFHSGPPTVGGYKNKNNIKMKKNPKRLRVNYESDRMIVKEKKNLQATITGQQDSRQ